MDVVDTWDGEMQMFRQPGGLVIERLCFQRWLVRAGMAEHGIAGPPCGEYASESALQVYMAGLLKLKRDMREGAE